MRYAFIERHEKSFPVQVMCRVLNVSRSGYYDWRNRGVSPRQLRQAALESQIRIIHQESRGTYGSPRILEKLRTGGTTVNHKAVESIMKRTGIRAKTRRKFKQTTDSKHSLPIAPNLLNREFAQPKAGLVWVSDLTYVPTAEGWLYLAVFIDLCTRKVVGWSMSDRMTADLVVDALCMGVTRQGAAPLMVHSDRGSQYASESFRTALRRHRCIQSMSRKGDCWDNAVAEGFFATLKKELIHHEKYKTRESARLSIFDYVETFYNKQRLHSHLNYASPETFEATATAA